MPHILPDFFSKCKEKDIRLMGLIYLTDGLPPTTAIAVYIKKEGTYSALFSV